MKKTFHPSAAQIQKHRAVAKLVESGKAKGLAKAEGLALLAKLQKKAKN